MDNMIQWRMSYQKLFLHVCSLGEVLVGSTLVSTFERHPFTNSMVWVTVTKGAIENRPRLLERLPLRFALDGLLMSLVLDPTC